MANLTEKESESLQRLIAHAKRDSGQSRRVAEFLLAWWNAGQCGGFDFSSMWACDDEIVSDMIVVFAFVARSSVYPDNLGLDADFSAIVSQWRPELADGTGTGR